MVEGTIIASVFTLLLFGMFAAISNLYSEPDALSPVDSVQAQQDIIRV